MALLLVLLLLVLGYIGLRCFPRWSAKRGTALTDPDSGVLVFRYVRSVRILALSLILGPAAACYVREAVERSSVAAKTPAEWLAAGPAN